MKRKYTSSPRFSDSSRTRMVRFIRRFILTVCDEDQTDRFFAATGASLAPPPQNRLKKPSISLSPGIQPKCFAASGTKKRPNESSAGTFIVGSGASARDIGLGRPIRVSVA